FLTLILFSTLLDYVLGLQMKANHNSNKRKLLLGISIICNLGLLGFFKYYNFFIESFTDAFTLFGGDIQPNTLNIILPVGISFYTFQTLSYTIDVYRNKIQPTSSLLNFATFVCFFLQLVAGPIERATQLLPQFETKRSFHKNEAILGVHQILWGLFKKLVIADNCAQYANDIFSNHTEYNSITLILGAVYFAFQIYGDFSGYSDIAIGTARLFGIRLMVNFKFPYFSRDIAEFWRRWHVSLSTWFRDYLYIPLGGSRGGRWMSLRNIFIVFIVSGFWHGANWTFITWGTFHALLFLPLFLLNKNKTHTDNVAKDRVLPNIKELGQILLTFTLVTIGWVFFRADTVGSAFQYLIEIGSLNLGVDRLTLNRFSFELLPLLGILLVFEWPSRHKEFPLEYAKPLWVKAPIIIFLIILFGSFSEINDFIYFQF
nr:MBOAT family protein [Bacteroidota bacterium]